MNDFLEQMRKVRPKTAKLKGSSKTGALSPMVVHKMERKQFIANFRNFSLIEGQNQQANDNGMENPRDDASEGVYSAGKQKLTKVVNS